MSSTTPTKSNPPSTKFVPHTYQQQAINFIETHPQAAIFLGMGMGKTAITLTAINNLTYDTCTIKKTLIIAPLRVARDTWPQEQHKWEHLKHLRMATIIGTKKQRQQALATEADVYVTNHENTVWLINTLGKNWDFDMIVIDELTRFKSPSAKKFRALAKTKPHHKRIIGLTGTPAPNTLEDLWAPFKLLDGGQRLGTSVTRFRHTYFNPTKYNGHIVYQWAPKPGAEQHIYQAISDITLSMHTTDHLTLPPLTITNHTIRMNTAARKLYNRFKKDMVAPLQDTTIDAASAGVLAGKLRQLASGAIYTPEGTVVEIHHTKLDAVEDLIEAAAGHPVLVAYEFKHDLARLKKRFPHGRQLATTQDMRDWNRKKIQVGFIHPQSAGHGLNLQEGGHHLIWFTVPWSLENYEQTNARLFRQGQTQPVSVVRLVCENTVDENVIKALESKNLTQQALMYAVASQLQPETPTEDK